MNKFTKQVLSMAVSLPLLSMTITAKAQSATCVITVGQNCYTNSIPANKNNHFVHITLSPFVDYTVIDSKIDKVVYRGSSGFWGVKKTITGLYSDYKLHIMNFYPINGSFDATGTISNLMN